MFLNRSNQLEAIPSSLTNVPCIVSSDIPGTARVVVGMARAHMLGQGPGGVVGSRYKNVKYKEFNINYPARLLITTYIAMP